MKPTSQIKPVSYLKAHTTEVIRHLSEGREPLIVTQNGEAKAVMQDIATFEETQETLALLKTLPLRNREVETVMRSRSRMSSRGCASATCPPE